MKERRRGREARKCEETNSLLVSVFPCDLLTIMKIENKTSFIQTQFETQYQISRLLTLTRSLTPQQR